MKDSKKPNPMSLEVYVLLKRSRLPSLASWQAALDGSWLGVKIDGKFNPVEDSGVRSVLVQGF